MTDIDLTTTRPDDDPGPAEPRRLEPPPRVWLAALTVLVLLSLVEVRWDGTVSWSLRATVVTAVLVAAIWLPSLLGLVARYGGTVSAAGIAFGIEAIRRVGSARSAGRSGTAAGSATWRGTATGAAAGPSPLSRLEDEYESLRARLPPSFQRSTALETILAEARLTAAETAPQLGARLSRFREDGEGARIITVALLQAAPGPLPEGTADALAQAVLAPRSSFEEYHVLRAARDRRPDLDPAGAAGVVSAVRQVLDRGGYPRGSDRLTLARQVVSG